ncbi:hypothetical protein CEXT_476981 [Caerostris extrusa]|uniref:Uncharacterized protein n=1 Tax=Caerostris extrusa TaxID=172846 RepID=A0AAV4UA24_CAEEX|nr:hypothetical protein CEXT_476981 [Caerostris extrusa]
MFTFLVLYNLTNFKPAHLRKSSILFLETDIQLSTQPINNELDTAHKYHKRTLQTTPISDLRLIGAEKRRKTNKNQDREALLRGEVNLLLAGKKN